MKLRRIANARGFTLVEVLVSLIIIAVGMLGLAKIETLAYANTGVASQESLAALQAASLASAMRANRGYWSTITTTYPNYTYSTASPNSDSDAAMTATTPSCALGLPPATFTAALCTPTQLAAYDLNNWFNNSLKLVLPNPKATISCTAASGTALPGCNITISWVEENVAIDNQSAGQTISASPSYTLYVVP